MSTRNDVCDQWIYDVIDGTKQQEMILFRNANFLIVRNIDWLDTNDISQLQLLVIPTDKNLHTMRSLTSEHLELLNEMKEKVKDIIKEYYNLDFGKIRLYFHYRPSTFHLHIHVVALTNDVDKSSVEYSHELHNVIFNIQMKSNYYQKIILNIHC